MAESKPSRKDASTGPSKERLEAVRRWLEENVRHYPTPAVVTLSAFNVNWKRMSGSFAVTLDDKLIDERFSFDIDVGGRPQLFPPMFVSPLGTPASYVAVLLTNATEPAILEALRSFLPRVLPLGRDPRTGNEVTMLTPMEERILEPETLQKAMSDLAGPAWTVSAKPAGVNLT